MTTRTLDRIPEFDERSRAFPIRSLISATTPRSYTWGTTTFLDQGSEGACVGFAWAQEMAAKPKIIPTTEVEAHVIYKRAQRIDEWDGENYVGTSVLAGAKVVQSLGYLPEYRWAFGLQDLILAVGRKGPAVIGVNWYDDMFNTDADGYIHAAGPIVGGHATLLTGVNLKSQYFTLHNSWGREWGVDGKARISFNDMNFLLRNEGEACIPVARDF